MGNKQYSSPEDLAVIYETSPNTLQKLLDAKSNIESARQKFDLAITGVEKIDPIYAAKVLQGMKLLLSLVEPSEDEINNLKIDARIAKAAMTRLRSELNAISNRLTQIMSDIPQSDKKAEIIPALHSCEIIFGELSDENHIFYQNALKCMTHVLSFGALYANLMQMTDKLLPHYDHTQKLSDLRSLLEQYLKQIVRQRLEYVIFYVKFNKGVQSESMSCPNWYDTWIEDKHLNRTCTCNDHEYFDNGMSNFKKLRENIASKYTEKFNEVVSSFSTIKISIPQPPVIQKRSPFSLFSIIEALAESSTTQYY